MTKKQKEQIERGLTLLWCLSKQDEALEAYRKADRDYCLLRGKWEDVLKAMDNARYYGVSEDQLVEVSIEVSRSITDEELYEALNGN